MGFHTLPLSGSGVMLGKSYCCLHLHHACMVGRYSYSFRTKKLIKLWPKQGRVGKTMQFVWNWFAIGREIQNTANENPPHAIPCHGFTVLP